MSAEVCHGWVWADKAASCWLGCCREAGLKGLDCIWPQSLIMQYALFMPSFSLEQGEVLQHCHASWATKLWLLLLAGLHLMLQRLMPDS